MSDEPEGTVPAGQRACAFCGRPFIPRVSRVRYCTTLCSGKANAARREIRRRSGGANPGPRDEEGVRNR